MKQIFKFKVNSGTDQEVWGVYIDIQSIHSKWTIDAILQHMGFYATTENPNVMMNISHIYIIYIKFHQFQHYLYLNIPIYKKQEKLIYDFILYTRNFLQIMRSTLSNENENKE